MGLFQNEYFPYTNYSELNLDWIIGKMKELLYEMDEISTELEQAGGIAKEYTDRQIAVVRSEIATMQNALEIKIEDGDTLQQEYTDSIYKQSQLDLEAAVKKLEDEIDRADSNMVISAVTGELVTVQTEFGYVWQILGGAETLTAAEYDGKNLTAAVYDRKQITAYDYDFKGKTILA